MELIAKVAKSRDTPVLIMGETGTGKELLASAIHYKSPNFRGPFRTVNCAAIPKDLIESELFGYEKGAFSGASASGKKGLIEDAANGTLFMDEVGDLNLEAQAKLLRFLELGEFYRVGGTKKFTIQTRVISATNKDLDKMIANDLFRKDLFFRLGVIKVQVPTLNGRPDDIIPLAKHFLLEFNRKFGKEFRSFSTQAEQALKTHKWVGNIRELKNVIEKAVLLGEGSVLGLEEVGLGGSSDQRQPEREAEGMAFPPIPKAGLELDSVVDSLERYYIEEALRIAGGNESKAAKLLKMNHHTYRYRRRKLKPE
jgi:transcriptional regulator with PAS, ATPase and Fis domain